KGDPSGRPRVACYAARNLVRMPPYEGRLMATRIVDSAERIRPEPAQRDRCGLSRFGHREWVGERRLHESPQVSDWSIDDRRRRCKGYFAIFVKKRRKMCAADYV